MSSLLRSDTVYDVMRMSMALYKSMLGVARCITSSDSKFPPKIQIHLRKTNYNHNIHWLNWMVLYALGTLP